MLLHFFSISIYSLLVSYQSWQNAFFYFRFVSKSHQKCQEKCRDLQIFLVQCVLSGFFMIWDMMGQTIPDSWQRLNMTIWFEGSFCVAGHVSKPLKCLKMVKLWLWNSAKDRIGHIKKCGETDGDVYFALACLKIEL